MYTVCRRQCCNVLCFDVRPLPTAVYDTETCEWHNIASVQRFRHSSWGAHHASDSNQVRTIPCRSLEVCEACKLSLHFVWHVLAWICMVGMGGLLFSYGGFDHKNPRGSQLWGETLDSKPAELSQWLSFRSCDVASGHFQQQICRRSMAKHGEAACVGWFWVNYNDLTVLPHWNHGLYMGNHPLLWPNNSG